MSAGSQRRIPPRQPLVVRSRQHLESKGVSFTRAGAVPSTVLPIAADGVTYSMAQQLTWVDVDHFVVGRWDGSLSVFRYNESRTAGPVITTASSNPSSEGVQMIVWLAPGVFAASAEDAAIAVWRTANGAWTDLGAEALLAYDPAFGAANSGASMALDDKLVVAIGHANGFLSIWAGAPDGSGFELLTGVDLRSAHPVNPWNSHNIRGVSPIRTDGEHGYLVTGSEDGDLCVVRIPDGAVLSRTVFNPSAQRGINSITTVETELLVASCSVGHSDKNLWYYGIDDTDWSIHLRDSVNLRVNRHAPQVFNFCTIWAIYDQGRCFFSSTEEGALWMGTIQGGAIALLGHQTVTPALESALGWNRAGRLALVGYDLHEFQTLDGPGAAPDTGNSEELAPNP